MNRRSTRMPNFTAEEEAVLIALAYKYKSVIEKKGSNGRIWREKQLAWSKIAAEFHKTTNIQREAAKLRSKYDALKKSKKMSNIGIGMATEMKLNVNSAAIAKNLAVPAAEQLAPIPATNLSELQQSAAPLATTAANQKIIVIKKQTKMPTVQQVSQTATNKNIPMQPLMLDIKKELLASDSDSDTDEDDSDTDDERSFNTALSKMSMGDMRALKAAMQASATVYRAQLTYYRNKDKRAEEKHRAELENLRVHLEILKLEQQSKALELSNFSKQFK
ncbi:uncharacterized protein LOC108596575 isoform X2 [Drosophila busckii]|uniref:uncharacterized protein LOC108596575 isoform X2 n=1 Tax=Drosophila busckii TaxID=30019 RepID=UPI00083ED7FB|nr:uncharacterized protein LOC108596575 isoform X2 [Drosophila busckii]